MNPYWIIGGSIALVLLLVALFFLRRAHKSVDRRLRGAGADLLRNFVVPDGLDSEIHVQYALLTHRGIVVIDVRDVTGNVFGSDAMEEWTVLSSRRRFTFVNPQHAMFDRIAAIKRLLPDVPVEGFVIFTDRAEFQKGQPTHVRMLDRFIDELADERRALPDDAGTDFEPQWNQLRESIAQTAATV